MGVQHQGHHVRSWTGGRLLQAKLVTECTRTAHEEDCDHHVEVTCAGTHIICDCHMRAVCVNMQVICERVSDMFRYMTVTRT